MSFDLDAVLGLAMFAAPFVGVGLYIRKANKKQRQGREGGFTHQNHGPEYNVNGLPMTGAVDVQGNPYGTYGGGP